MVNSVATARMIYNYIRRRRELVRLVGRPNVVKVSSRMLSRRLGISGKAISKALTLLEEMGLIRILEKRQASSWTIYILELIE